MKQLLTTLLVFLCTITYGQYYSGNNKEKIAVYVTGSSTSANVNKVIGNRLVSTIVKQGKYIAVERSTEILAQLQKEYGYQQGGNVDVRQISQVGKQLGVDIVCVAEIIDILNTYNITVKLIDVETAAITDMNEAYSDLRTIDNLMKTTDRLAAELLNIPYVRKQKGFHLGGEGLYLNGLGWGGAATVGYRFNNYVALGAGGGYALYAGENFTGYAIPVFADLRVNILPYAISPYIAASGGACFDSYTNTDNYIAVGKTLSITKEYKTTYIYYHVSAGLYVRCSEVFALHAGAGYNGIMITFTASIGFAVTFVN
jgi:hypothetical protein